MSSAAPLQTVAAKPRKAAGASLVLQRKCACGAGASGLTGECAECGKNKLGLQTKPRIGESGNAHEQEGQAAGEATAPAGVDRVLAGPGRPLDPALRQEMEQRFGHDFSRVRVHADAGAVESARAVRAHAYTVGSHIVFNLGKYAPRTRAGAKLLAHELTHVVQQEMKPPVAQRRSATAGRDDAAELEAERLSDAVVAGRSVQANERPGALLQGSYEGAAIGAGAGALLGAGAGALIGSFAGPLGTLVGAGIGAVVGGIAGAVFGSYLTTPLTDMSTFQSPGASGWWGAKYGCYRNNCTRHHEGWDLHAPVGTHVRAVTAGIMTHHENAGGYGHYALLTSSFDSTRQYLYAHLSARERPGRYLPGQKLGESGVTGNAQANRPHLHFQVRSQGAAVDPARYFSEPDKVVDGGAAARIDKSAPPPCAPCAM